MKFGVEFIGTREASSGGSGGVWGTLQSSEGRLYSEHEVLSIHGCRSILVAHRVRSG
eukprot:SAG11_NODE_3455_length_2438_cov_1.565626_1_plen_57_part_00